MKLASVEKILSLEPIEIDMAEGKSLLNKNTEREGLVFRCTDDTLSFKSISNKFLLKNNE